MGHGRTCIGELPVRRYHLHFNSKINLNSSTYFNFLILFPTRKIPLSSLPPHFAVIYTYVLSTYVHIVSVLKAGKVRDLHWNATTKLETGFFL